MGVMSEEEREHHPPAGGGAGGGRMTRSRRHRVVGGVCGGMARYFDLDPVIFRIPLVVLSLIGGVGFIAYGIAWLVLPFPDEDENEARRMLSGRVEGPGLSALLCIVVGFGLLLGSVAARTQFFSLMLLGTLVGAAYWSQHRRRALAAEAGGGPVDVETARAVATAPPEAQAPPAPAAPSWWRGQAGTGAESPPYLWGPPGASEPAGGEPESVWAAPARPRDPDAGREFWLGGPLLLAAVAAAVGVSALFWDRSPLGTVLVYGLSSALAVFGLGLVASAFRGRLGLGTIVAVVLTGALLAGASALPRDIATEWKDQSWRPSAAADVAREYELGTGHGELDLSGLELGARQRLATSVDVSAGQLTVIVPHDALVEVTAQVWLGGYQYVQGDVRNGGPEVTGGGLRAEWSGMYGPDPGTEVRGTVRLELRIGVGRLVVQRAGPDAVADGAGGRGA